LRGLFTAIPQVQTAARRRAFLETSMPSPRPPRPEAAPLIEAVKITDGKARPDEVTYAIIKAASDGDKRAENRQRTRLLSGKVLNLDNKFLIDCQIHDRSAHGARLILVAKVKVPRRLRLFGDIDGVLVEADVAWQRGQNVGINFTTDRVPALTAAEITALRQKIYVV
jgi:hypothetical protein